jgi:hypothetical protein
MIPCALSISHSTGLIDICFAYRCGHACPFAHYFSNGLVANQCICQQKLPFRVIALMLTRMLIFLDQFNVVFAAYRGEDASTCFITTSGCLERAALWYNAKLQMQRISCLLRKRTMCSHEGIKTRPHCHEMSFLASILHPLVRDHLQ